MFNPHGESFSTDNLCISDGMYSITWSPTLKGSQDVKACPRFHQGMTHLNITMCFPVYADTYLDMKR